MKNGIIALCCAALVSLFLLLPVMADESEIKSLADPAFGKLTRPAAVFNHDKHNEMAKIEECTPCHHESYVDGKFTEGDTDAKCADCHKVDAEEDKTPLMLAYHKMCGDCHTDKKKGPVACGQCHVKS